MAQSPKTAKKGENLRNAGRPSKDPPRKTRTKVKADPFIASLGRELAADSRATMFGGNAAAKSKLVQLQESQVGNMRTYYKKMALRCGKCSGKFDHEARPRVEYELKCPHCDETHLMSFIPVGKLFSVHAHTLELEEGKK